MNPQLENGYTRIADEILEKVAQTKLNGTQLRILLIVWRCTYGWQKKEHELSEGYLSKATGIHKQQIKRELKVLIEKDILIVSQQATFNKGRVLKFNKRYLNSSVVAKKIPHSELDTTTGSVLDTTGGSGLDTQNKDINKQYNKKHAEAIKINAEYNFNSVRNEYNGTKTKSVALKKLPSLIDKYSFTQILNTVKRYNMYVAKQRSSGFKDLKYMNESTFWNGRYVDYLDENYEEENTPSKSSKIVINRNAPIRGQ